MNTRIGIGELNEMDQASFVRLIGPVFESSPWIAERTWPRRPFESRKHLHEALCRTMYDASREEQLALIRAHPDLVGRAARAGTLTPESTREQAGSGLGDLSPEEVEMFDRYNQAYRDKFSFPFVICARENKKESILAAFPVRLQHSREEEIEAAMREIAKIAWFRIADVIRE